jgi:hypothetical protein
MFTLRESSVGIINFDGTMDAVEKLSMAPGSTWFQGGGEISERMEVPVPAIDWFHAVGMWRRMSALKSVCQKLRKKVSWSKPCYL